MLFLEIQIYLNIQIILTQIFIRTFIRIRFFETNKFGYSFVQKHLYEYIQIFVRVKKLCEYIRIFIRVKNLKRIYSDIRSSPNFDECHTLILRIPPKGNPRDL